MNKPIWLKSTYLKGLVSQFLAKRFTKKYLIASREDSNRIVIISIDGLGDAFLRLSIVDALAKKHGPSNLRIVTRAMTNPLYEKLGIQTIIYSDRHRTNPLKRIKLINQINRLNVNNIYVLDFEHNESLLELLAAKKKIGFQHPYRPDYQKQLNVTIPHPFYVGTALENFCRETGIAPKLMDNRSFFPNHDRKTHPSKLKASQ
ncbi:MAG: hypothetical protein LRY53_09355 [Burkholderiaceae bacterium]|nr:hypothetical protein [Burkholderiaceae bacterium]